MKKLTFIILLITILISLFFLYINKTMTVPQAPDALTQINEYQKQYWNIIKKHNLFIQIGEIDDDIKKDKTDLENLYKRVKAEINLNNKFYIELDNINNAYNTEINNAQTQTEMNILTGECVENTDKILNNVYKEIKNSTDNNDFEDLKLSEIKWIQELEEYQKFIEKQDFGSIIGLIYGKATLDIKYFRTLLLIYYLEQKAG